MIKIAIAAIFFFFLPMGLSKKTVASSKSKWLLAPIALGLSIAGLAALLVASYVMTEMLRAKSVLLPGEINRFVTSDFSYWLIGTLFVLPFAMWRGARAAKIYQPDVGVEVKK
jgi:hypothetical protein